MIKALKSRRNKPILAGKLAGKLTVNMTVNMTVKFVMLMCAMMWSLAPRDAFAIGLLRDAETEWFLMKISAPLFKAAGLDDDAVNIYIVNDNSINAFVAGGQNIFINTGLILKVKNVNQLLAVIAHETGHISGAHLARNSEGMSAPTSVMLMSMLLGAAAILAGSPDAGIGMMMGGQTMAERSYLKYTRVQESAADQAGARLLEATQTSAKGMIETFEIFRDQELLSFRYQDPYARSHPVSSDRISSLQQRAEKSKFYNKAPDPVMQYWFERVRAKLMGYAYDPVQTFQEYPSSDTSVKARYARVYAYHKQLNWDMALSEANELVKSDENDPYFQEIIGQIYAESGRIEQSIPYYRKAIALKPNSPLILTALAQSLINQNTPAQNKEAVSLLEKVVRFEPDNDFAWRQLGQAYSQLDEPQEASLATAELFSLYGRYPESRYHAQIALDYFPEGSPKWIRAQDIIIQNENMLRTEGGREKNNKLTQ